MYKLTAEDWLKAEDCSNIRSFMNITKCGTQKMGPKDVHVLLLPEPVNMLPCMAKQILQMSLRILRLF